MDSAARILIVDDEPAIRRFLRASLTPQGYVVTEAADGRAGLAAAMSDRPDLVILDLGLPDLDGVQVTRALREWSRLPIIILSVRDRESDKIAALDAGADDYLTKPFGLGELLARIRVALRRHVDASEEPIFRLGGLAVDLATRHVTVEGVDVQLTPTEYELLRVLVRNAGKVMTHRQIMHLVWGEGYQDMHILRVNVSNLRRKIETDPGRPRYVITDPGVGYRMELEV
jgi:two-component system KDP operon response regulator KdpE